MTVHPEVEKFMTARIGETRWCPLEVFQIGEALLNSIATTCQMGHSSPGSLLDYLPQWSGSLGPDVVADYIAWTSGRKNKRDGAEQRLRDEISDSGWHRHCTEQGAKQLFGGAA